jgi:hydrogenase-4 component B
LIGFGTKAGMIPLHIWLPEAHPAAPTHVSAVMSGVMIKTAIYGMCRFYLEFLGVGPVWWGVVVLILAAVSAVLGILYALMERDAKSLLAYSSVENIGIILLGVGAGLVFMSKGLLALAGLAWAAALFHVLNHAVFKSLLFMGTGAVLSVTHTRNIEQLGGLIKRMPYTAVLFLIGTMAISALPPLNGFVSEWLTFQSLFVLPEALSGISGRIASAVFVGLLGLTGALAAACFVKAFGMFFLAKPRSTHASSAQEVSGLMLAPMGLLVALCIALGLFPAWPLAILQRALGDFLGYGAMSNLTDSERYFVGFKTISSTGELSSLAIVAFLAAGLAAAAAVYRIYGAPRIESGETWTCGIVPNAKMEYTGTGFSGPIRRAFGYILKPRSETVIDKNVSPYSGRHVIFQVRISHVFDDKIYHPLNLFIVKTSHFMKKIQTGSVQLYIGYIMVVTIIVLVWSTRW